MLYVIQNKGHLHGYHNEHYCIQQWIYLSISLEREAMHVKLGKLEKTELRPIKEIHI